MLLWQLPAYSQNTIEFEEVSGTANPFYQYNPGNYASPDFVDIDGDGDQDAFFALEDGNIVYYENTGTELQPFFEERTGTENPLNMADGIAYAGVAFVDVDGDGDDDAFVSSVYAWIKFYQNNGTPQEPVFELVSGAGNPLDHYDEGFEAKLAFSDIDNDGDWDVFIGDDYGDVRFYKNEGSVTAPQFVLQQGDLNPMDGVYVGDFVKPAFADLDLDGDDDLLLGVENGNFHYFENTGSPEIPHFTEMTGVMNPFSDFNAGIEAKPVFVDLDGDNDEDLIAGNENGDIRFYRNLTTFTNVQQPRQEAILNLKLNVRGNILQLIPGDELLNEQPMQITLLDINGKIMLSETATAAPLIQLNLPQLAKGIYIVQLKAGTNVISTRLSL